MALDYLGDTVVGVNSISLGAGGRIWLRDVTGEDLGLLDRFGIKEQVLQDVAEKNAEALRELQERFGVGAEQGLGKWS